jgi:hypothetical protein
MLRGYIYEVGSKYIKRIESDIVEGHAIKCFFKKSTLSILLNELLVVLVLSFVR